MSTHDQFTAAFWDERYRGSEKLWSGEPNAVLVQEVAGLAPGMALDVGSGEGGDAIWLAARGWTVTAIDVSSVGLSRVAARAAAEGVGERVTTTQVDVLHDPVPGTYDLVTAHFLQLWTEVRPRIFAGLAGAVAPGGRLLLVGHDPEGMPPELVGHHPPEFFATAEQLLAELGDALAGWTIETAERRARTGVQPESRPGFTHDVVLMARRAT
jgi:SAM-dependent methyltransferase